MFKFVRAASVAAAAFVCLAAGPVAAKARPVTEAATAPAGKAQPAMLHTAASLTPALPTVVTPRMLPSAVPAPVASAPTSPAVAVAPAPAIALPVQAQPAAGVAAAAAPRLSLAALVVAHAAAPIADEQFECLASAVYFESRGEPLEGQLAVAEVILNRVRSGRFRGTICDVVRQPSQFSFVRRGVIPAAPRESAAWQRAVAIAHIALNDLADATGDDSLFFHATYVNPRWGRPRIARIGNHIFYR